MADVSNTITTVSQSYDATQLGNKSERLSVTNDQIKREGSFTGRLLRVVVNIFSLGIYGLIKDNQVKTAFTEALKNVANTTDNQAAKSLFERTVKKLGDSTVVGVTGNVATHFRDVIGKQDWAGLTKLGFADAFRSSFNKDIEDTKKAISKDLRISHDELSGDRNGAKILALLGGLSDRVEQVLSNPQSTPDDVQSALHSWAEEYHEAFPPEHADASHKGRLSRLAKKVETDLEKFVLSSSRAATETSAAKSGSAIKVSFLTNN